MFVRVVFLGLGLSLGLSAHAEQNGCRKKPREQE
jgi:hypothetical protein